MKYLVLDAGFPMVVVTDGSEANKSIAAYTPGMLIDALRQRADKERSNDNDGVGMMLDASAKLIEDVVKKHYGDGLPKGD
jgi:hypothetical protein